MNKGILLSDINEFYIDHIVNISSEYSKFKNNYTELNTYLSNLIDNNLDKIKSDISMTMTRYPDEIRIVNDCKRLTRDIDTFTNEKGKSSYSLSGLTLNGKNNIASNFTNNSMDTKVGNTNTIKLNKTKER